MNGNLKVAAIVLAAGRSSRMAGTNKLTLALEGRPLILHAVEAALAAATRPVIVVTGHQCETVAATLVGRPVAVVHNPDFAAGLSTSLKAGIAAVPPDAAGALVLLGDMPRVTPALIGRLAAAFAANPEAAAIVPVHAGERGNPVLLSRRLFAAIAGLGGDAGARRLLAGRPDVVELPVDDDAVTADIDTPEAFQALAGPRR
jgi:molybdenum cofactor cytidylyltransferase